MLGAFAQAERPPVQGEPALGGGGGGHEQLGQPRQDRQRALAAGRAVVRDVAPAENGQPFGGRDPLHRGHRLRGGALAGGQESQAGRVTAGGGQAETAGRTEKRIGDLGEDARPVPGLRVAALRAAVVQVAQDGEGLGHRVMGAPPGQVSDEADPAGVMFVTAVVQPQSFLVAPC